MTKISRQRIQEIAERIDKSENKMITKFVENLEQTILDNVDWSKLLDPDIDIDMIDTQLELVETDVVHQVIRYIIRKRTIL